MADNVITLSIIIFVIIVSYLNLRFNKAYNFIILIFCILGFLVNIYFNGLEGFISSIQGMITGLLLLIIPFSLGWLGDGDVKLVAALGSFIGSSMIMYSILYGLIFFAVVVSIYLIIKKRFKIFLRQAFLTLLYIGTPSKINLIESSGYPPIWLFLALGTLSYWIYCTYML
ncbi:prepilin peptidase [Alkalithermobacter paradoxus]|uniref:Type IV leader peptidase family protein n=1 Tax=Alkalithermobacter paradoxus TaxID=29349 RepID=A0A1V4IBJ4_9FIRM|nr:type IV leader peptidase family protein [[Clostridium] thermoalcaliphilum]